MATVSMIILSGRFNSRVKGSSSGGWPRSCRGRVGCKARLLDGCAHVGTGNSGAAGADRAPRQAEKTFWTKSARQGRKEDAEGAATADGALDEDARAQAFVMPCTTDRPVPCLLRPVGCKNVRRCARRCRIHARAGIANREHHVAPRRQSRAFCVMQINIRHAHGDRARGCRQSTDTRSCTVHHSCSASPRSAWTTEPLGHSVPQSCNWGDRGRSRHSASSAPSANQRAPRQVADVAAEGENLLTRSGRDARR